MSDTEKNYPGSERKDGKKKDGKKDKKEKGYVMFDADASDEELVVGDDLKSPSKMKKAKAFRFGPKKDKEEKKEKEGKKEEKEKRKGDKKHKIKGKKKTQHDITSAAVPEVIDKPVFGVALTTAIERNRSHDGVQLPALFRECIDYIEEHGLHCEGIYRISGVKSKVQHLKDLYNRGQQVYLEEHEPNIVAGVLKQFLRELPEPVLTNALIPKFEEASTIRNERRRIEAFLKLIKDLPLCNKLLLSWMIVHMTHVIEKQQENKMTLQNVSIVLSPTMQISHRVLNVLFSHTKQLFKDTLIKRYVPPLKPATSRWSLELPDNPQALEEELAKQESLLNQLHEDLHAGKADSNKAEQIWEVQRVCTQLKRKIKLAHKNQDAMEKRKRERDEQSKRNTVMEEGEEELRLELREPPEIEVLRLDLQKPPQAPDAVSVTSSVGGQGDAAQTDETSVDADADKCESKHKGKQSESDNGKMDIDKGKDRIDKQSDKDSKVGKVGKDDKDEDDEVDTEAVDGDGKVTLKELANKSSKRRSKSEEKGIGEAGETADGATDDGPKHDDDDDDDESAGEKNETKIAKGAKAAAGGKDSEVVDDDDDVGSGGRKRKEKGVKEDKTAAERKEVGTDAEAGDKTGEVPDKRRDKVSDKVKSDKGPDPDNDNTEEEGDLGKGAAGDVSTDVKTGKVEAESDVQTKEADGSEVSEKVEREMVEEEREDNVTEEDVKSNLIKKQTMLLQEDTTDSELGHSRESIQKVVSESDEFEQSLDEILERDLNVTESDREILDDDSIDDSLEKDPADTTVLEEGKTTDEAVAMETKTPVPIETPESPPTITPVPDQHDDADGQDTEFDTSCEVPGGESAVEFEISEMSEMSEDETVTEEEFQKLLEQEYALKLEEEELLAIENELRKKIETERCESEWLQQEIDELQYLRHDSEEETFSTSSDSSYESEDEDDLQEILQQLIKENETLEGENSEMCSSIHKERMICLEVKVQIGILQQNRIQNSHNSDQFTEKESLIEFD